MTQALQFVEIDIDHCSLTYGIAPCTASLTSPATGTDKCFNTLATCQDRPHFATEVFTYRFAVPTASLPPDVDCIPNIKSITFDSGEISLGKNLGSRATITITFEDHKHSDTGIDKYLVDRTYDPYQQGTFFGKFRARVPFVRGRALRWINGAVGQSLAAMERRYYIIDSFSGPTNSGEYVLIAKDILKLADGDRSLAPAPNAGYLAADITDTATSLTLLPASSGADYGHQGYVTIGGSEIVSFAHQSGFAGGGAPNAVHLDGSNDLLKGPVGGLVGAADSTLFTISFWLRKNTAANGGGIFATTPNTSGAPATARVNIRSDPTTGKIRFVMQSAAPATVLDVSNLTTPTTGAWVHYLASFDLSSTTKRHIYVNDANDAGTYITYTNTAIDFTNPLGDETIGGFPDLSNVMAGDFADFWFSIGTYLDMTVVANRRKFITADLRPVSLGASGQLPTGASPIVFLGNPAASWQTNLGTGGNFTVIGGGIVAATFDNGDSLSILARGQLGTTAASHSTDDRVQAILQYAGRDPADIIADLLGSYAGISSAFIPLTDWQLETHTYLNRLYTANIAIPTPVTDLVSELIEQAGLAVWWDDLNQEIGLIVLRGFVTGTTFTQDNTIADSLEISEQPDKRLSEVDTYFGQINPLTSLTDKNNFKSVAIATLDQLAIDYGSPAIKEIFSRWIPAQARATADRLNTLLLSRYQDPPRHFKFSTLRGAVEAPLLAHAYNLNAWPLQDALGAAATVGFQVTRLRPMADLVEIEGDELLYTAATADLANRTVIFDTNILNANAATTHDLIYPPASSGDAVTIIVPDGVVVGSASTATPALDIGTWPAGVNVTLQVIGRIQGHGGNGGVGETNLPAGTAGNGLAGGTALFTRKAITLVDLTGEIWGGAGGGGARNQGGITGGGGGGAGTQSGAGGVGSRNGAAGTDAAGGIGGDVTPFGANGIGGTGGGPGLVGNAGTGTGGSNGTGGAAGNAIDGISFVTTSGGAGDRRGGTVN